jgi:hypothetical protein
MYPQHNSFLKKTCQETKPKLLAFHLHRAKPKVPIKALRLYAHFRNDGTHLHLIIHLIQQPLTTCDY